MADFLSQDSDYHDLLRTKLGDLQGADTLIHELAQNAHDSYRDEARTLRATRISFDIRDDGLLVENDGVFSSCGDVQATECLWQAEDPTHERCDFHRFRKVAGGDKAREDNVFGAFGVGFISVYQITDRPEFRSSGLHWTLDPAQETNQRVQSERDEQECAGTRFWLPWAPMDASALGTILRRPPVDPADHIRALEERGAEVAESAIMFLENIESIELLRNGKRISLTTKTEHGNELVVDSNGVTRSWLLIRADFESHKNEADVNLNGLLSKRSAKVTVAIPEDTGNLKGLLFCGLPTRQPTQLPFHVNAHFFPSSDRKRIDVEGESYQVQWNLAALHAAATAIAAELEPIGHTLGPEALWSLLARLYAQNQRQELQDVFWSAASPACATSRVVFSSQQGWHAPADVVYLHRSEEERSLRALESLGLTIAHPKLRPYQPTLIALGVRRMDSAVLADAISEAAPHERTNLSETHEVFAQDELRLQLSDALLLRFESDAADRVEATRKRLTELPICLTASGHLASPQSLIATPSGSESVILERLGLGPVLADSAERCGTAMRSLVSDQYVLKAAKYVVKLAQTRGHDEFSDQLRGFFGWLHDSHMGAVRDSNELAAVLARAAIWPGGAGLHVLEDLAIPGGFNDSLGLARTLDTGFAPGVAELAASLGCSQLSVVRYAVEYVPAAFAEEAPTSEDVAVLLIDLASRLPELMASESARTELRQLPLVPCSDGETRRPAEVMFDSSGVREVLGDGVPTCQPVDTAVRSLLEWLGVASSVTVPAIIARVRSLAAGPVDPATRGAAQRALRALAGLHAIQSIPEETLAPLHSLAWLPALDDVNWHRPSELLTAFRRETLFGSHGLQLDFPRKLQQDASALLSGLHLRQSPNIEECVGYVEELLDAGTEPSSELFKFLDQSITPQAAQRLMALPLFAGPGGNRFEADRAFLSPHPFGRWAVTLQGEWGALPNLLGALHIRRDPTAVDASRILGYIEYEHGEYPAPLDSETLAVVNACWALIGDCPELSLPEVLSELEGRRCAPDARDVLVPPDHLYFNDQPAIAGYLVNALGAMLIPRAGDAWRGLARAGVADISQAISVRLLEVVDGADTSGEFRTSLTERREAVLRAMAQDDRLADPANIFDGWLRLECVKATSVSIQLTMTRPHIEATVDCIQGAFLDRSAGVLYVVALDQYPAAAVARELLTGANVEAGHLPLLVTAVEQVLAATDLSSAQEALDVRGFARFKEGDAVASGSESTLAGVPIEPGGPDESSESGHEVDLPHPERISTGRDEAPDQDIRSRKPQRREERLRSYVAPACDGLDEETTSARSQRNLEIDAAGTDRVMAYERSKGRVPQKMAHLNKGYDVMSEDSLGRVRYIEVKSTVDLWGGGGVGITPAQHDYARRNPDEWWLYVVEAAESDQDWAIYCINNFAERTYRYMFDDGWRVAAKEKSGHWKRNEASFKPPTDSE